MTHTDTLKMALEALEKTIRYGSFHGADWAFNEIEEAITAIKETLQSSPNGEAQPEQEPVAWKHDCAALLTNDVELWIDRCPHCGKPRTSPQPPPQPKEPEQEPDDLTIAYMLGYHDGKKEAAHGIKE